MSITFHSRTLLDTITPRKKQVFVGERKTFFEGSDPGTYICHFTDAVKKDLPVISGKGVINNRISELLFSKLTEMNIATHFIRRLNMREQMVRATEPLSFKMKIYNTANKSLSERFLIEKGTQLPRAIFEFTSKGRAEHVVSREHILSFGWSNDMELEDIVSMSQRVNDFLSGFFIAHNFRLMSVTMEFGRLYAADFMEQSELLMIDELSPDTFELQDTLSGDFLSLDLSDGETDLATAAAIYHHIAERLGVLSAVNTQ